MEDWSEGRRGVDQGELGGQWNFLSVYGHYAIPDALYNRGSMGGKGKTTAGSVPECGIGKSGEAQGMRAAAALASWAKIPCTSAFAGDRSGEYARKSA